jgi:hypothetical protein
MAGPEGFDASLIETEALLKRMKPRPANLSAARIVYEAGRAVGKEEMQAQLVGSGMVMAAGPATASWKKWVVRTWAGGATAVCLVLLLNFALRGPQAPDTPKYEIYGVSNVAPSPGEPGFRSPGFAGVSTEGAATKKVAPDPTNSDLEAQVVENQIVATPSPANGVSNASSDSDNQSGAVRNGRPVGEPKKREKNLAEYLRDQLPSLEAKRNFDPLEPKNGALQPPGAGGPMALTTLGFIKTP